MKSFLFLALALALSGLMMGCTGEPEKKSGTGTAGTTAH